MVKRKHIIGLLLLVLVAVSIYIISIQFGTQTEKSLSPAQLQLIKIGDQCLDFGERAVANDVPIVEFQMLVRLAKKTNVIERCMADNGYKQNPAWLQYAQPIAVADAAQHKISVGEALTKLSRADMQIFTPHSHPDYWIKK